MSETSDPQTARSGLVDVELTPIRSVDATEVRAEIDADPATFSGVSATAVAVRLEVEDGAGGWRHLASSIRWTPPLPSDPPIYVAVRRDRRLRGLRIRAVVQKVNARTGERVPWSGEMVGGRLVVT